MLELKNIVKDYPAGNGKVNALRGVSLKFRKAEFISILGPSGCGKTTLLNIIGGLDQYTSGDLVIDGVSTKNFEDRDWDTYRNHSIGFVFQSYNLIPHQTVLQNVELALSISGVSKAERKKRAKKALEDVGLAEQMYKKPNEMSGGQMQRVAIARALVTNPDIILADEPTGALDTETSVQVMDILKKVSQERLVIMVTHNPDLAEKYSTRIIRMLDGQITDDSAPVKEDEISENSAKEEKNTKKPSMSFRTSFMLSLKNLFTKKGRTTLTAFAGSIGIIGIALILSISQGMSAYINATQENALSSYPITIERTTVDLSSLMNAFMSASSNKSEHDDDAVYKKAAIYDIMNALNNLDEQENDLISFKKYLEGEIAKDIESSKMNQAVSGIQYTYALPLQVYTKNVDGAIIKSDASKIMTEFMAEYMGMDMSGMMSMGGSMSGMASMGSMSMNIWQEMLPGKDGAYVNDVLKKQYDVVYGSWPNDYDEVVLVLDENNELDDLTLYTLGLQSKEDIDEIMRAAMNGEQIDAGKSRWEYKDICKMEFRVVLNSSCYTKDELTGMYVDLRETEAGTKYLYDNGLSLKISGIIRPNEDAASTMLSGAIGYTSALTEYVVKESQKSGAITEQMENKDTDILTGLPFKENTGKLTAEQKKAEFCEYVSGLSEAGKAKVYIGVMSIPTQQIIDAGVAQQMQGKTREEVEATMIAVLTEQMGVSGDALTSYVEAMSDEEIFELYKEMLVQGIKLQYSEMVKANLAGKSDTELALALDMALETFTDEQYSDYYDEIMVFSESSYENNLLKLGYVDLENPASVNIFASSFANKDVIEEAIAKYNEGVEEVSKIKYTDYVGIMMASVTTIIDAITYVLIAFVAISLIVSSIMIGVITLISVQERTKEIGILRAIGASKKDVSSLFNAETLIIGFASGALGVLITYVLCIPINAIIYALTGIAGLRAYLPLGAAVILVVISMVLTLISGVIPSRSAAKKEPVVALRTE